MHLKTEPWFMHQGPMAGKQWLFNVLESNDASATTAVFDSFPMFPKDIERLEKIIRENMSLRVLSLIDCNVSAENLEMLAPAILSNRTLHKFKVELFDDYSETIHHLMAQVQIHLEENMNNLAHSADVGGRVISASV